MKKRYAEKQSAFVLRQTINEDKEALRFQNIKIAVSNAMKAYSQDLRTA